MVISIYKFLAVYYGIVVDSKEKYSHVMAKQKFDFLKGCSFAYAEANPQLLSTGKIICVSDMYGNILPYHCPEVINVSYTEEKPTEDDFKITGNVNKLSTYELHQLLSIYKDSSYYFVIKRELEVRGEYTKKKYKLMKELLELEEGGINDKYQRRRKIKHQKP